MADIKRYLIDNDTEGRSSVIGDELTNEQGQDGFFWRSTLWTTSSFPPDNVDDVDISAQNIQREPGVDGILFRALEIAPDDPDPRRHRDVMEKLHAEVGQKHAPTEEDLARHPGMHKTGTLDFFTCVFGEIQLMTDTGEVTMRPGDTAIVRGGNHAWSNQGSVPCLLTVVLVHARAR